MTAVAAGASRPVADVMRHGVVLCDADASVRDVARTMRDRGVQTVLVVDISSELVGLVDEPALALAWDGVGARTAAEVMDTDPVTVDPAEPVADVARRMLAAGATTALVAPPAPAEESGRWSEWKERGLPLGTLSVGDLVGRLDDLPGLARSGRATGDRTGPRASIWVVAATVVALLAAIAGVAFALATVKPTTTHPGCAIPTQGGC